jgi:hypothetical protein
MPSGRAQALGRFGVAVWVIFVADYVTRVVLVDDRRTFIRRHIVADYVTRVVLVDDRRTFIRRHMFDVAVIALPMLHDAAGTAVRIDAPDAP